MVKNFNRNLTLLSSSCALDEPVILSISLALDFWQVGCLWPKFSDVFKIIMFLSIIHTFLVPIMASTEDGSQKWGSFFLNHTAFRNCLLHFIFLFLKSSLRSETTWSLFSVTSFKPSTVLNRKWVFNMLIKSIWIHTGANASPQLFLLWREHNTWN